MPHLHFSFADSFAHTPEDFIAETYHSQILEVRYRVLKVL